MNSHQLISHGAIEPSGCHEIRSQIPFEGDSDLRLFYEVAVFLSESAVKPRLVPVLGDLVELAGVLDDILDTPWIDSSEIVNRQRHDPLVNGGLSLIKILLEPSVMFIGGFFYNH